MNKANPALETLFNAARVLPLESRREFVELACKNEPALRDELHRLLEASDRADGIFEAKAFGLTQLERTVVDGSVQEGPGTSIGRYKLLQQIGEGGMGVVYMAEQEEPIRRRVALKIIKLGMDTAQVVARFEAERQALAMMDHPSIARVLDAGTTDSGRPYFVMELVQGVSIIEFCDKSKLSANARLDLFIQVCEAVQSAHQKGIIHRDIKPSNILVTLHHGKPIPKVIDFGIAKATNQRLTEKTLFTQYATMIGTPAYMSPEQAEMTSMDVDTRSDIYSLGVLLYEMLTGSTPFPEKRLRSLGYGEMQRVIADEEPERPSTRLSTMGDEQKKAVATNCGEDLAVLNTLLRGDLDWIVMKCLEKDRTRRYETANSLAADLRRHLGNEPVAARPPSLAYRIQKAVRRNKLAYSAASAVVMALVLGLTLASIGWRRTGLERDRSRAAESQAIAARMAAETAQRAEREQRERAVKGEADSRLLLYAANMNLAQKAWDEGNVGRLLRLLDETQDSPHRGFEWYYWQQQARPELKTLRGHMKSITAVAYSPDGTRMATCSEDGNAKVWDAATGRELLTLQGHSAILRSVAFSPDGRRIVTAGLDATARVWDASNGRERLIFRGHRSGVMSAVFLPDGEQIATGGEDKTIRIWNANSGLERLKIAGSSAAVFCMAVSPDGLRLVAGHMDGTTRVWKTSDGSELLSLNSNQGLVFSVAFSPDGSRIATVGMDTTARVWDAVSGQQLLVLANRGHVVTSVAFSPDGRYLVTGNIDQTARVWDAGNGTERHVFKGHVGWVLAVAFAADGRHVLTGSEDATAKVWEVPLETEKTAARVYPNEICWMAFSPNRQLIAGPGAGFTAGVWDVTTGTEVATLSGHSNVVAAVAFSPDGQWLATASYDNTVKVWEVATGKERFTLRAHVQPVNSVAFSPDGKRIVSGSLDSTARVWDAITGEGLLRLNGSRHPLHSVAISPDNQRMATGDEVGNTTLWEAATGEELAQFSSPGGTVWSLAFSPDGKRIAAGLNNGAIHVLGIEDGEPLLKLEGHGTMVVSVAFSPDGRRLASASLDKSAKLWETVSGKELFTLKVPGSMTACINFSPDGQRLLSGSLDGTTKVWEAATADQVEEWQADELLWKQRLVHSRAAQESQKLAKIEAVEREIAAKAGVTGPAPKHHPSTQRRPAASDDPGVIRQWLVLAPLPFEGEHALHTLKQQLTNEAQLRPRASQHTPNLSTGLAWKPVQLGPESYQLNFIDLLKRSSPEVILDNQVAYAVAYIESDSLKSGLKLLVGSDDTARIYLNGKEIYRQLRARPFELDDDEVSNVALDAGMNVLVFKVVNSRLEWAGSVRLLGADGQPIQGIRVTLDPDGKR